MIIKSKPLSPFLFKLCSALMTFALKRFTNKLIIKPAEIKPDHSYILMCNHFSFTDGVYAYLLSRKVIWNKTPVKQLHLMVLKKQMQQKFFLKYLGCFSIDPGKRSIKESFEYAAEILSQPGNVVVYFPQGNLESNHISHIHFEDGLNQIIPLIKGKCQLIWSSNIIEYFESMKPSIQFNMLDCGTNDNYAFEVLKEKVNTHHLASLNAGVRFTRQSIQ
jgi:1-acyl-sn-glycerol-3-phosphate acyltransferase